MPVPRDIRDVPATAYWNVGPMHGGGGAELLAKPTVEPSPELVQELAGIRPGGCRAGLGKRVLMHRPKLSHDVKTVHQFSTQRSVPPDRVS